MCKFEAKIWDEKSKNFASYCGHCSAKYGYACNSENCKTFTKKEGKK